MLGKASQTVGILSYWNEMLLESRKAVESLFQKLQKQLDNAYFKIALGYLIVLLRKGIDLITHSYFYHSPKCIQCNNCFIELNVKESVRFLILNSILNLLVNSLHPLATSLTVLWGLNSVSLVYVVLDVRKNTLSSDCWFALSVQF